MTKTKFTTVLFFLICLTAFGQQKKDLDIDFMLRGHIYAESSITDSTAAGGFADSDNLPKRITESLGISESRLFLKIDTTKTASINNKFKGYKLYIGNKSNATIKLEASDSRLYAIAEVFYKNTWQPIEYLPSSWCGNSYHNVYLKQNEYWEFDIPKFTGKIKTRLRYRLMTEEGKFIYSNEILASFNKGQLKEKQGHTPNGIMDPYND